MGRNYQEANVSNATYILGTVEYLMLEIECETPGVTFVPADWTAKVTLVELGTAFDDDAAPSIWTDATLETVGEAHYAKVLLGDEPAPAVGKYRALVRLTKTLGGSEIPLLKAIGTVTVEEG
jgi:hypothetical protein